MAARVTRKEARERLLKVFMKSLDEAIPPDENKPLKGRTFLEWERQGVKMKQALIPTLLEELAALDEQALVDSGGSCPHCGSDNVYLEKQSTQPEIRSPDGVVNVMKQHCRCRACGGSFSPSEP
jgi:transposase